MVKRVHSTRSCVIGERGGGVFVSFILTQKYRSKINVETCYVCCCPLMYLMSICSDLISHRLHRHEPPISSTPIEILFNDGKLLVVNKPASMPVHPSGRYRFNSLVEILKHDLQISTSLGLVNRLDRLTSGVCILSVGGASTQLHRDMAAKTSTQTSTSISSRPCFLKSYLARVKGQFPPRVITCDKPLRLLSHKLGVVVVDEEAGKDAYTSFEFLRPLGAEGEHSLVRCVPR